MTSQYWNVYEGGPATPRTEQAPECAPPRPTHPTLPVA